MWHLHGSMQEMLYIPGKSSMYYELMIQHSMPAPSCPCMRHTHVWSTQWSETPHQECVWEC